MADKHPRSEVIALLERLVDALEGSSSSSPDTKKTRFRALMDFIEKAATPLSVLIGATGIVASIWFSQRQLETSSEQFERTMRQNQYSDIVGGLASSSVGVQVNSIRRLVQYVADEDNFDSSALRLDAAANAAQTLAAFIEDESSDPGDEGLSDYRDPQPVVVSRAFDQLVDLARSEGSISMDLSRGNFHGVYQPDFKPRGTFKAVAADFRGAIVTGWDLTNANNPDLSSAFFTCADLQTSDLGEADVGAADFTGANLRGANLSAVSNLESEQLSGALVGQATRLPPGVDPPESAWGVQQDDSGRFGPTPACRRLMEEMTHLTPGAGYSARLPCDGSAGTLSVSLSPIQRASLGRVCRLRTELQPQS